MLSYGVKIAKIAHGLCFAYDTKLVGIHDIFPKSIDCHSNVPRQIGKQGTGLSSALKALSYSEKIVKISPVYPEIFD